MANRMLYPTEGALTPQVIALHGKWAFDSAGEVDTALSDCFGFRVQKMKLTGGAGEAGKFQVWTDQAYTTYLGCELTQEWKAFGPTGGVAVATATTTQKKWSANALADNIWEIDLITQINRGAAPNEPPAEPVVEGIGSTEVADWIFRGVFWFKNSSVFPNTRYAV